MAELKVETRTSVDWQKRCLALETQLFRFRLQASKIRELLADKMQELEQRLLEAEQRAENAETQVGVMEEKVKLSNLNNVDSSGSLHQKYQQLLKALQGKDELIGQLEAQLEKQKQMRAEEAKIVQEKAAKIKEWVTLKLAELEIENQHLKSCNQHLVEQVGALQDALEALQMAPPGKLLVAPQEAAGQDSVSSRPRAQPMGRNSGPHAQGALKAALPAPSQGSLQSKDSAPKAGSSLEESSSIMVRPGEISEAKTLPPRLGREGAPSQLCVKTHSPRHRLASWDEGLVTAEGGTLPGTKTSVREGGPGCSLTLPKVRAPSTPRDSVQLAKRHHSQPQVGPGHFNHVVSIEIGTLSTLGPSGLPKVEARVEVREEPEKMEMEEPPLAWRKEERENPKVPGAELEEVDLGSKPPTPPLHRFPSWESRIYAVAMSGMRLSDVSPRSNVTCCGSRPPALVSPGPFSGLVYKNGTAPVYTALKGRATQISTVPFVDESSGSDDDCSSQASFRTSVPCPEPRKTSGLGSPRAIKRGVSMSSLSSEGDYAIPPDACSLDSDYSEPEHKLQRTSSYSTDGLGLGGESLEKSGYLLKMGSRVKTWKRRWFVLQQGQILYYKSPSDVIRKPQGQVELNSRCQIVRGEGAQTFQLISEKKTYYLTADSPNLLEEWIRALQSLLKVQATGPPVLPQGGTKPTVRGWLTKVKHGHSKLVWCALIGRTFYYYRSHEDKRPLGHLPVRDARIEEVDRSCDSDEDYEAGGTRPLLSSHCTLVIHPPVHSPTYLLIGTKHEKDTWLYHLTVAAGGSSAKVGTAYEQLIGKLMDGEGDPDSPLWKHPMLCYSKDGLYTSLTTLPSEALQTEALKLFKSCQLFINVPVEAASVDYHVSLAQTALQVCLVHPELQSEIYCQLMKQTSCRPPQKYSLMQGWQLLALCAPLFLPQHHFLWYVKQQLQRHADPRNETGQYATYCQRAVERTLQTGEREARPSRMEVVSILLRNPFHHSLPFSIPVHFANGTYQVVGFDGSSTVDEFLQQLNQETGMRKSSHSGFALFTDDPSGRDLEHCLQGSVKICDAISRWEQALKELHSGKSEGGTRVVKLMYKNRLYFRSQVKGETERERLLLAFQASGEIVAGRFPVNKELALEMAALMAQVEYGDLERPIPPGSGGTPPSKTQHHLQQVLDRFYPRRYRHGTPPEQLRHLTDQLTTKWASLQGCSPPECIRIYLTVARKWPFFGAKLFAAQPVQLSSKENTLVWIAVNEDGVSILDHNTMQVHVTYPYSSLMTFGGCRDDFMLVIRSIPDQSSGKGHVEKLIFRMAVPKIAEATFIVASYMNHCSATVNAPTNPPAARKPWELDGQQFFAPAPRAAKGPTLL
ncbi:pleckstrin homology domain-containing family H member 1 isoform X1 [Rousettus aegyptiacus]|uniref:Pleckstrin homology, MyTH4 and FERM domain containing H1 n=2 Tax=Rousettus aegyptiacus TaxID=9407 RepID=A0A7J8IQS1_ROUAE|nr:pleckstrin homology domain-containing family H member 1 isoform X1 [Rousettus aegyptiacus]XP_015986803.2 pleckstrin homology domain-containing family H member 1 isoform X1 [Rousettus aegyptiacus]KAF6486560.1 pleckstrin homology, MyTH4 and FERM domain containing H1 [Rousettus aegyptiacus]